MRYQFALSIIDAVSVCLVDSNKDDSYYCDGSSDNSSDELRTDASLDKDPSLLVESLCLYVLCNGSNDCDERQGKKGDTQWIRRIPLDV